MINKIMTKSEKEKKERRGRLIVGIVLVAVMIVSTLGYSLLSGENEGGASGQKISYNGIDFYNNGNEWQAVVGGQTLNFLYSPPEVKDIKTPEINFEDFYNKAVFLDSNNPELNYEIARNLQYYAERIQEACLNETDCSSADFPLKTCADNVIVIRTINQTTSSIVKSGNCTFISGNEDILKAGDAFLYKTLGIINNG